MSEPVSVIPAPRGPSGSTGPSTDPLLTVDVVHTGDGRSVVLVVAGELDLLGAPLLRAAWESVVARPGADVLVDLGGTTFCGAAGLRVLMQIERSCHRAGTDLRVAAAGHVARLLAHLGSAGLPRPGGAFVVVPRPRWVHDLVGAESVQMTLATGRRTRGSLGCAGPLGHRLADLEAELGEGPAWQSHCGRTDVEADDLHDADSAWRWPALAPAARDLPVRSVLCLHLGTRARPMGTLTVVSSHPAVFGPEARRVAGTLAAVASLVLGAEDDSRTLGELVTGGGRAMRASPPGAR